MKFVGFKGKLYSPEYKQKFETKHSVAEIKQSQSDPNSLLLTIDGVSDGAWFRQKHNEFLRGIGIKVYQEPQRKKGIRM